ncbi:MAG TPA: hypothetical protein DDW16_03300 [Clostridiales bacterium]|nr:hypothetical protein [Clostridiales bacterium]
MEKIKKNWLKLILWAGAYVNLVIFALCGGYVYLKTEDEDVKKEVKKVFLISLLFTGLSMLLSLIYNILGLAKSSSYDFYYVLSRLISIAKIITFVVFGILAFFSPEKVEEQGEKAEDKEVTEETKEEVQEEQNKD